MIALAFRLLAGRYHATGWDHHVNEGTVEWPPSPWRVLRALVAASSRLGHDLDRPRFAAILERLTELPVYWLPAAAPGHLRHYMPTDGDATTKVFDTFLAVGHGAGDPPELVVAWPSVELSPDDRVLLAAVAAGVAYLGRAESWADAKLCDDLPVSVPNAHPVAPGDDPPAHARLLAPVPAASYATWRDGFLAALNGKQRTRLHLPESFWDVLNQDTGALQQGGWSTPPGTRWVTYTVPEPAVAFSPRPVHCTPPRPDLARIVLDGAVLPRVEKALWLGERIRAALLSKVGDLPCPVLTGKDDAGRPLQGHRHAFFLPQPNDRGEVTHIFVYARDGFDPRALAALRALQVLYGVTSHPIYTTLAAVARVDTLESPPPAIRAATHWESLTPFVPPRVPKRRRGALVDTPEDQIRRLCREIYNVEPSRVELFDPEESRRRRLHTYRRERQRRGPRFGHGTALGVRLEFAAPLRGPLVLGHGAHFGLGQFTAI